MTVPTGTTPPEAAPAGDPQALREILLAEYKSLKDEQSNRIDRRNQLVYGTVTAVAAAVASVGRIPVVLLLLPIVLLILGWTHLTIDQKVAAAGGYLRDQLRPRLSALAGEPVLNWENTHRADPHRPQRNRIQLGVDLALYPGTALGSLTIYLVVAKVPTPAWIAAALIAVIACGLASQQVLYSRPATRGPAQAQP